MRFLAFALTLATCAPFLSAEDRPPRGEAASIDEFLDHMRGFDPARVARHEAKVHAKPQAARFGRCIELGHGLFPRVAFRGGRFYVAVGSRDGYRVTVYDSDWKPTGVEVNLTPSGEKQVDQDIALGPDGFYHFAMLDGARGIVRKFDWELLPVAESPVFRAVDQERILDQNIAVLDGLVYAGSEFRDATRRWGDGPQQNLPPTPDAARGVRVRVLDADLKLLETRDLSARIDAAAAPVQHWGLGASQLLVDGVHCVFAVSPVGNVEHFRDGESIGARQVFLLRFDPRGLFLESVGPLTDTDYDNFWCTGSWHEDGRYYVSYTCLSPEDGPVLGPDGGGSDQGNIRLGIYDESLEEIETIEITNYSSKDVEHGGAHRSDVLKVGDRLYVSYDSPDGCWAQELILER